MGGPFEVIDSPRRLATARRLGRGTIQGPLLDIDADSAYEHHVRAKARQRLPLLDETSDPLLAGETTTRR